MKYSLRSLIIAMLVLPPLMAGIMWLWWSPWFWHVAEVLGVAFGIYGFLWWISSFRKSSTGP